MTIGQAIYETRWFWCFTLCFLCVNQWGIPAISFKWNRSREEKEKADK
jgi:hypothetical protein